MHELISKNMRQCSRSPYRAAYALDDERVVGHHFVHQAIVAASRRRGAVSALALRIVYGPHEASSAERWVTYKRYSCAAPANWAVKWTIR